MASIADNALKNKIVSLVCLLAVGLLFMLIYIPPGLLMGAFGFR